jgi:mono/diheme cytochrome c family protein
MAVLVFVLFWVLVAIGLVVTGIRSGRGGKPSEVQTRRGGRAYWYVAFAIVLVGFGAGLPIAASFGRDDDSRSVPQADINHLTDSQEQGREMFHQFCSVCHSLEAAKAVARVGPDLDTLRPTKALVLDAIKNGRARGNGAMARNLVVGEDAEDVADFVALAVGKTEKQK